MKILFFHNTGKEFVVVSLSEVDKKENIRSDISIEISDDTYKFIQENLKENTIKFYNLDNVNIENLILEKNNDTVNTKHTQDSEFKIMNAINERIGEKHNFYTFGFNILFNKLVSKGYFITEDNREEKFLEILETEDEELIFILEKYLSMYDYLYSSYNLFMRAESAIEEIKHLNSIEEKQELTNIYLQQISDGKFY